MKTGSKITLVLVSSSHNHFSFSGWSADRLLIAFSSVPVFEVYLSAGRDPIHLLIEIRDQRDCLTEWTTNLSSITVLMNNIINGSTTMSMNPFIRLLTSGTHNQVGQVINSLS
jgi:hypothetical protein